MKFNILVLSSLLFSSSCLTTNASYEALESTSTDSTEIAIANATTTGLLSSIDWAKFNAKLDKLEDDTDPKLGADLNTNGHDIISDGNDNINLKPSGTGQVVIDTAITRKGFLQVYSSTDQNLPSSSGANLSLEFNQETRIDTDYYEHSTTTDPEEIKVLKGGYYKVHYTVSVENRTQTRNSVKAWLTVNDVVSNPSTTYDYTRSSTYGRNGAVTCTTILNLASDDVIKLHLIQRYEGGNWGDGGSLKALANQAWILIEKI